MIGEMRTHRAAIAALTMIALLAQWQGGVPVCAGEVAVQAALDKSVCFLGERVILAVRIAGVEDPPEPIVPPIEGVEVERLGPQRPARPANPAVPVVIFGYALKAQRLGRYTVPEIAFTDARGNKLKTAALTFDVVASSLQDDVLLEIVPNKTDVYQYEAIQITVKLLMRDAKRITKDYNLDITCLQEIPGFVRAEPEDRNDNLKSLGDEVRGGKRYDVYGKGRIFFPETPGERTIPPATMRCKYMKDFVLPRRSAFPDPMFDDVFGAYVRPQDVQQIFARSAEVKINVRPLPSEGRPEGFSDAVGQYQMRVSVAPDKLRVGDPVTLIATITGAGYPMSAATPQLQGKEGLKVYPWETETASARASNRITVTKTFKAILEPQTAAVTAVPAVLFPCFDPAQGRYVTLREGPFPISVVAADRQGMAAVAAPGAAPSPPPQVVQWDIRPIVTSTGELHDEEEMLYRRPGFLALLLGPLFLASASALIERRRERFRTDTAYARRRQAMRMAKRRLQAAGGQAATAPAKEFQGILFKTLTEYIADKLNIAPAAVTCEALADLLAGRNVRQDLIAEAASCLRECEHGMFSAAVQGDNRTSLARIRALLKRLERGL